MNQDIKQVFLKRKESKCANSNKNEHRTSEFNNIKFYENLSIPGIKKASTLRTVMSQGGLLQIPRKASLGFLGRKSFPMQKTYKNQRQSQNVQSANRLNQIFMEN